MRRGEVWWADLPAPVGPRPVLLLSRDDAYQVRSLVIVSPVTTRIRNIPAEVRVGQGEGLPQEGVVNLDVLQTIQKGRLQGLITSLNFEKMREVNQALRFALGIP